MSTSGSVDFALTRSELCTKALRLIGVLDATETAAADEMASAVSSLNIMLKAWAGRGIYLWTKTEDSFPLVSATASYVFGAGGTKTYKPLKILSVRHARSATNEVPLLPMSREEYFDLPDKTSAGSPTSFYYDPQRATGRLYLWPVLAGTDTIKYTYARMFEDMDEVGNEVDFPQEWFEAVIYNLAIRCAPEFGKRLANFPDVVAFAAQSLSDALDFDREDAPVQIVPHHQYAGW